MSKSRIPGHRHFVPAEYVPTMSDFEWLVLKAARGHSEPLIDYFGHDGPFELSEKEGSWLAWLLELKLPRPRHRPRGSSTPTNNALRSARHLLRRGKQVWCKKHGRQRVSKKDPIVSRLAKRALELVEQEIPSIRGKISFEAVRDYDGSIRPDEVQASLEDFLPEAMWEIKLEALK
jgi:hypothetical protein